MSVTGQPGNGPEAGPVKVGVALSDVMTGLYAVIGVQAALAHRDRTGEGQHVDLALLDVQVATLANQAMNYLASGNAPGLMGNAHPNIVPYQAFATLDGHMILAVGNDNQFAKFCKVASMPELAEDERFTTNASRVKHREELVPILRERIIKNELDWWISQLETAHVPCGPINTIDRVFADPQVQAREMKVELDHPIAGKVPSVGSPLKFSSSPVEYRNAPPVLAADTKDVLESVLSLSEDDIAKLVERGIVQQ